MYFQKQVVVPILTGLAGCLLGGIIATDFWLNRSVATAVSSSRLSTYERVRLLRQLRANRNQEATVEQEILLNGDITTLGAYFEHGDKGPSQTRDALTKAASYRQEHPYLCSTPEEGKAISRYLSHGR